METIIILSPSYMPTHPAYSMTCNKNYNANNLLKKKKTLSLKSTIIIQYIYSVRAKISFRIYLMKRKKRNLANYFFVVACEK